MTITYRAGGFGFGLGFLEGFGDWGCVRLFLKDSHAQDLQSQMNVYHTVVETGINIFK